MRDQQIPMKPRIESHYIPNKLNFSREQIRLRIDQQMLFAFHFPSIICRADCHYCHHKNRMLRLSLIFLLLNCYGLTSAADSAECVQFRRDCVAGPILYAPSISTMVLEAPENCTMNIHCVLRVEPGIAGTAIKLTFEIIDLVQGDYFTIQQYNAAGRTLNIQR